MPAERIRSLPWWRRLRRRLYYWLLLFILWFIDKLSPSAGRRLGRTIARTGAALRPRDCQRAYSNIALAFPDRDKEAHQKIFKDSVIALGENFYDTLTTPKILMQPQLVTEELVQGGRSLVDEITQLASAGRGVLILTGHLGCWELLGGWVAQKLNESSLGPLAVVTGSIHNAPVDEFVQGRRRSLGMKLLPRDRGAAPMLRHLRAGGVVAVLLDQNTRVENLPIPFFGQEAPTPTAFARLALGYGIPVLPVVLAKNGSGHIIRRSEPLLPLKNSDKSDKALGELLLWCNGQLENFIRRNPEEWVWFHKRWPDTVEKTST